MNHDRLPIRELPIDGEHPFGYLLRLAMLNGRSTVSQFLEAIDYPGRRVAYSPKSCRLHDIFAELDRWVLSRDDSLLEIFSRFKNPYSTRHRYLTALALDQIRVCPECLCDETTRFIRHSWNCVCVTHCYIHRKRLISACPSCNSFLKWNDTAFFKCSCCNLSWMELKQVEEDLPPWQREFNRALESDPSNELAFWADSVLRSICKAARPFDLISPAPRKLPSEIRSPDMLIEQAWSLATNERYILPIEWDPKNWVENRRLKHEESIRFHVDFRRAAKILEIESCEFAALICDSICQPLNKNSSLAQSIFDAREVQMFLDRIPVTNTVSGDFVEISPRSKLLRVFGLRYGEVIYHAHIEGILFKNATAFGLKSISLIKNGLKQWLFDVSFRKNKNGSCSKSTCAKILCVGIDTVDELIGKKALMTMKDNKSKDRVKFDSLFRLLADKNYNFYKREKYLYEAIGY